MKKIKIFTIISFFNLFAQPSLSQEIKIARLKYDGGGDWYANKTALINLISFTNENINTNLFKNEEYVDAGSADLFLYPYVYMTGHGNVNFNPIQSRNLKKYLTSGAVSYTHLTLPTTPYV